MPGSTIRPATRADRAAIERLLTDSGLPVDGVGAILESRPDDFLVAESAGPTSELVGVGGLEVCCDDALLRSVAVKPEWRTRGVGRDLVLRLIGAGESRGLHALYLLTTTAEHYFPKFGFEKVDRASVPKPIAESVEFKSACPDTAVAMARRMPMARA